MPVPRIVVNPFFNDFVYDILFNATTKEKGVLPKRYLKKVKSNVTARQFVDKSYLEEKLEILMNLGFNWNLIVYEDKKNRLKSIKEIFECYMPEKDANLLNHVIINKIFVHSDRKMAYQQGLMSDVNHSMNYSQNLLLDKAGYHIMKWKKEMSGRYTDTAKNHHIVTKGMSDITGSVLVQIDYIDSYVGVTVNDFKILNYLYGRHSVYVEFERMADHFSNNLSLNKITGCLRRLSEKNMIQKTPKAYEKKYQITALGINAINNFYQQVHKGNEF